MTLNTLAKYTGGLLLLQLVGGIFLNFFFLQQLKIDGPGANISHTSMIIGLATILAIALSSVNLIVAAIGHHIFNPSYPIHSLLMVAFSTIAVGLTAVEYAQLGELAAWLEQVSDDSSKSDSLSLARHLITSGRDEIHYMTITLSSFSLLLFYALLYRATQMPRLLTGFALIACLLQLVALSNTFFQSNVIGLIQLPLFITQLVLPIYLVSRGLHLPSSAEHA